MPSHPTDQRCRVCGQVPAETNCYWIAPDLCSNCVEMRPEALAAANALGEAILSLEETSGVELPEKLRQLATHFFMAGFAAGAEEFSGRAQRFVAQLAAGPSDFQGIQQ